MIDSPSPCNYDLINSQINPVTTPENKNHKVHTTKILLDSVASSLIVRKVVLEEHHRILKDKMNKWLIMAWTFNTIFVTEVNLKHLELNHYAGIYAKCNLTNKLLNYDLILGRDILHKLGIIFNF